MENSATAVSFHYFYTFINAKSSHKELRGINGKVTVHQPAKIMNNISCVVFAQSEERSTPCHMEMCCFSFCAANVRISSKIEHNSYCAVFPLNAPSAMFDQKAHMISCNWAKTAQLPLVVTCSRAAKQSKRHNLT